MDNCEQNLDLNDCSVENNYVDNSYIDYSQINNITEKDDVFIYMPSSYNLNTYNPNYSNSSFDGVIGFIVILLCLVLLVIL